MKRLIMCVCLSFLVVGCSTTHYNKEDLIIQPDPSIMASCVITTPQVKAGDNMIDLVDIIVNQQKEVKECSILNEKKSAYIKSLF